MIKTKEKVNSQSENNLKSEPLYSKLKIGSIYELKWDVETETEILCEGTPLKVLSVDETNKTVECEDYRGKSHFIESQSLWVDEEIKKYPNPFKILLWKINNYLSDYANYRALRVGSIILLGIAIISYFLSGINSLYNLAMTSVCVLSLFISGVLLVILLSDMCFIKNPLFEKENLKELKILFNKKGAKTGSEAFTNEKGENT